GLARRVELLERRHEVPRVEQLEQGGALATRDHEPTDLLELPGHAHLERRHAHARERAGVLREVPLERQDPDGHGRLDVAVRARYHPRVWSRSDSFSLEVSMPGMASPSSSETRASTSGSL